MVSIWPFVRTKSKKTYRADARLTVFFAATFFFGAAFFTTFFTVFFTAFFGAAFLTAFAFTFETPIDDSPLSTPTASRR